MRFFLINRGPNALTRTITLFLFAIAVLFGSCPLAVAADILIDPGHSPKLPGAISCSGVAEYRYNYLLAAEIANYLSPLGHNVSLTKSENSVISLSRRAALSKGQDLLVSIHHDSVQPQFVSRTPEGGFCSYKAKGFSIFISRSNRYYKESLHYARTLGKAMVRRGYRPTLHHAEKIPGEFKILLDPDLGIYIFNNLVVLKQAKSPAILFEAAVIVHPEDEALAASEGYRHVIAESVAAMLSSKP
jgi:N-acetylmuramoyl-L-alanine amidase